MGLVVGRSQTLCHWCWAGEEERQTTEGGRGGARNPSTPSSRLITADAQGDPHLAEGTQHGEPHVSTLQVGARPQHRQ